MLTNVIADVGDSKHAVSFFQNLLQKNALPTIKNVSLLLSSDKSTNNTLKLLLSSKTVPKTLFQTENMLRSILQSKSEYVLPKLSLMFGDQWDGYFNIKHLRDCILSNQDQRVFDFIFNKTRCSEKKAEIIENQMSELVIKSIVAGDIHALKSIDNRFKLLNKLSSSQEKVRCGALQMAMTSGNRALCLYLIRKLLITPLLVQRVQMGMNLSDSQMMALKIYQCRNCTAISVFQRQKYDHCRCLKVHYCSRRCVVADYPRHKSECQEELDID